MFASTHTIDEQLARHCIGHPGSSVNISLLSELMNPYCCFALGYLEGNKEHVIPHTERQISTKVPMPVLIGDTLPS